MVGYTEVILQRVREVIEANRRGTWTINAVIVEVEFGAKPGGALVRFRVSVQTVDATPSGIKLFSKVVFMKQGKRFGLSAEQKSDVWRRWKSGQTLHEIGRAFGKEHSSIRCLVSRHGGIAPAVPRRALLALTLRARQEISRGLASGASTRDIPKSLGR